MALLALLGLSAQAQADEFRALRFYPPSPVAMCLGSTVARIGDVDGDAVPDIALSATNHCPEGYFGDFGVIQLLSGTDGHVIRQIQSPDSVGNFGVAVAAVDDLTGDGVSELAVGAPETAHGGVFGSGSVFIMSPMSGQVLIEATEGRGSFYGGQFGASVAPVGDLNGDGVVDMIVGAPEALNSSAVASGVAYVISGANGAAIDSVEGSVSSEGFSSRVVDVGDWNGDGDTDVAIASPAVSVQGGGIGRVLLYDLVHRTPIDTLVAGPEAAAFGSTLVMVGDIDGDGFSDLGVGAPALGTIGHVYVYSRMGTSPVVTLIGKPSELFGSAIASADFNGDGSLDLAVGARGYMDLGVFHAGAVYVYLSSSTGSQLVAIGSGTLAELGRSVVAVGDMNGDGRPDLLIGAPGTPSGSARLLGSASLHGYVTVAGGRAFLTGGGPLRVGRANRDTWVQLEPVAASFDLGSVREETVTLWLTADPSRRVSSLRALPGGDTDGNGVSEASLAFSSAEVAGLFESYGSGAETTTGVVEGDLTDGHRLVAPVQLTIDISLPFAVSVSPNPNRGDGLLAFRTTTSAECRITLFDVSGRRVCEWASQGPRPPGFQRISLSEVIGPSRKLAAGVYFYSVEGGGQSRTGRLVILR